MRPSDIVGREALGREAVRVVPVPPRDASAADRSGHPTELGDPLHLACGLVLPNRIAKAAMTECLADPRTNDPNTRHERLYDRWARGGPGCRSQAM